MCDCFHLAFPNWHAASSGTGAGRRLRALEPGAEDNSICDESSQFAEGERPRPQGSSPVEEFPETEKYSDSDKECEAEHDPHNKSVGSGKKLKKTGLGSMFEKHSTPKMSKLKEAHSPESGVIVKTAKDGCAEGLVYGGGGKDGIFIKGVVPESPASKSLKLKEGDQVLSATVYFDNISYEDAIQILEHAQAYKVKLCLKRKPDIKETEPAIQSDVIHEEELDAPDMREQGKAKRRSDARISWPKFSSLGKGRKSHFTRSHSSSEADEQRKLELSPTTSDTESPIKSQDALKGKKRHKIKLPVITKRGRISSSDDQDTDTPTGQISGRILQMNEASDMFSAEGLESPLRKEHEVYATEDLKILEDSRLEQKDQKLGEPQAAQHKAEPISMDSTLKTADLTVAVEDKENSDGIKSPEEKKKKKERSELKIKILGKEKSHKKDTKAKSSPKRLKTLGASIEIPDQPKSKKSDVQIQSLESEVKQDNLLLDVDTNTNTIGGSVVVQSETTDINFPQEKLDISGLSKSSLSKAHFPKREEIEIPGMEDISARSTAKRIKEPKARCVGLHDGVHAETVQLSIDVDSVKEAVSKLPGYKLPKVDTSGVPIPEEITVIDANAQRISVKTPTKVVNTRAKEESHFTKFDMTASSEISMMTVKLPKIMQSQKIIETEVYKREDIVIPGKESKQSTEETSPNKSHKKLKKAKTKTDSFGITKPDIKIPDIGIDFPRQNILKQKSAEGAISIPDTQTLTAEIKEVEGKIEVISDVKIPEIDCIEYIDSESGSPAKKNGGTMLTSIGVNVDATKLNDNAISELTDEVKDAQGTTINLPTASTDIHVNVADVGKNIHIDVAEIKRFDKEGRGSKFKMPSLDISMPKVKGTDLTLSKNDDDSTTPKAEAEAKTLDVPDVDITLGNVSVALPEQMMKDGKVELEFKSLKTEGELDRRGGKFKMPKFGIKKPKFKGPEFDLSLSKDDGTLKLPDAKAEAKLLETAETDANIPENADVKESQEMDRHKSKFKMPKLKISMPKVQKDGDVTLRETNVEVKLTDVELKDTAEVKLKAPEFKGTEKDEDGSLSKSKMQTTAELDHKESKFKMPKFEIQLPKVKGPEIDLNFAKKDGDITLPQDITEVKLSDVDHRGPSIKAEFKSPQIAFQEGDDDGSPSKFKMPTFKVPKFAIVDPVEEQDISKGVNVGEDVKITGKGLVKGPKIDVSMSNRDVVTLPKARADVTIPEYNLGKTYIAIPKTEAKLLESSNIAVEKKLSGSEAERDSHDGKFEIPTFGITASTLPGTKVDVKMPGVAKINVSLGKPEVNTPEAKVEVKKPEVEIKPLQTNVKLEGLDGKLKMPKIGITMPKVEGPELDLSFSKKDVDAKLPEANAEVRFPDVELTECLAEVQIPTFKIPKFGIVTPSVTMEEQDMDKGVKIKKGDINIPEEELTVDIKPPKIDVEAPSIQIKTLEMEHEGKGSKFKMPSFGFTVPQVKKPDNDLSLSKKDVDVTIPEAKAEITLPGVELKQPSADIEIIAPDIQITTKTKEGSPSKFKMPTFKFPKFGISTPSVSVEEPELDKSVKTGEVDIPEEELTVDIKPPKIDVEAPSIQIKTLETEHEGKGSKFKMPGFGFTVPQVKKTNTDLSLSKKDVDVTIPEAKAEVTLPDVELKQPSADIDIKAPGIQITTKTKEGSPSKFKMPTFKFPKFGIGTPGVSVEGPELDKDGKIGRADINIPEEELTVAIKPPKIDMEAPSIQMKSLEMEHEGKGSKFKMPSLGFTVPQVKKPNTDLSLSKKDVDVTIPEAKAEVTLPDVELKQPSADIEIKAPEIKVVTKAKEGSPSKFKMPTFKLPKFGSGTPSATAELPDMDKDVRIDGHDIKIPKEDLTVVIEAPNIDSEGFSIQTKTTVLEPTEKGSKFKMPSLGFSVSQVKKPDFDLSHKDVDVTLPEAKAEVSIPDVELKQPSADIQIIAPEMKLATIITDGSPSKFKVPTLKLPKFGIGAPTATVEMPDLEKGVKIDKCDVIIPEEELTVDIKPPKIDVEAPSIQMKTLETEHEGKGSTFKMPSLGFTVPQVKKPDNDLSLSKKDVDVTIPEAKAEITLPGVELKQPSADIEIIAPDIQITTKTKEGSPSKFKMPTFKFPKFGSGTPSVSVEGPDLDKDVKIGKVDINIPEEELTVDIKPPKIDMEAPSIQMKTHETEHEGKGSKFKMPSLGFTVPQVKKPDIDLNLSKKDVDVTIPEAKAEVTLPDVELKQPSADIDINAPDIQITTKTKEGSPSKFKMPTFKFPKFGSGTPSVSVEEPDLDKGVKIGKTDINIPEEELTVDIKPPKTDMEAPSIQMKSVEMEHEGKGSKFKMPSLGFNVPQVKKPHIDLNLSKKDVDLTIPEAKAEVTLPDVELKQPSADIDIKTPDIQITTKTKEGSPSKFKMPTFKFPKFGSGTPSVSVEEPDLDKGVKIGKGDINIPEEELTVDVKSPKIDMEAPSIQMKSVETEHEGKGSKFKMPSLGFNVPQVKKPHIDLNLSKKDVDVTIPEAKAEVTLPDVELKQSSVNIDINAPDIQITTKTKEGSPSKFKMPTFKFPKFGSGTPSVSVEGPDLDKDVKIGKADINIPEEELTVDIKPPKIDMEAPSIQMKSLEMEHEEKGSKFKMPSLGFNMPQVKKPHIDLNLSKKDVDVTIPDSKAEVTLPDVELKQSSVDIDINAPDIQITTKTKEGSPSKFKMPTFKFPKFGSGTPSVSVEGQDLDKGINIDKGDITIPEEVLTVDIKSPKVDIEAPSIQMKAIETEHEGKGRKFKLPSLGFSGSVKMHGTDLSLPRKDIDVTLPEAKAEVKVPDVELKGHSAEIEFSVSSTTTEGSPSKFKMPVFKFPKFGVEVPNMEKNINVDGEDLNIPQTNAEVTISQVDIKDPYSAISVPQPSMAEYDAKIKKGRFSLPKISLSKQSTKEPTVEVRSPEIDVFLPEGNVDVEPVKGDIKLDGAENKFKMPRFGIAMPKVKEPEIDLSLTKKDADVTIIEAKDKVHGVVKGPKGTILVPDARTVEVETTSKHPEWTFPKFSFSRTSVKAPDGDVNPETPKVDVNLPEAKIETHLSNVEVQKPLGDISMGQPPDKEFDANTKKSKFSLPKFSFSKTSVEQAEVRAEVPHVDISLQEGEVTVKQPDVELKSSGHVEVDFQESKFKMPKFGISLPKPKVPETDLSLSKKDVDSALQDTKAEVQLPGAIVKQPFADVDIKAPEIEAQAGNVKGSPLKFKMPTLTLPKFGSASPKATVEVSDMDKNIQIDEEKQKVPKEGANVDVTACSLYTGDLNVNVKVKGSEPEESASKFKTPKFGISLPKGKGPEIDLSLSKKDVDLPEAKGEVQLSDNEVQKLSAEMEIKSPEIKSQTGNIEGSPSKFKMPTITLPKIGVATPIVSVEATDVNKDTDIKEVMSKRPEDGATVDDTALSIDYEGLSVDLKAPESKFKTPKFGIALPKGPDYDLQPSKTDIDATVPEARAEVKLPNLQEKETEGAISASNEPTVEVEAKFKRPNWSFPKFSFSRTSVKAPDVNVNLETEADIKSQDTKTELHVSHAEIQGSSGAVSTEENSAAELDANLKKSKFSLPKFTFSKASGKLEVSAELPRVDVSLTEGEVKVKEPEIEMKASKIELEHVKGDIKQLETDVKQKDTGGSSLKFEVPSMTMPQLSYDVTIGGPDTNKRVEGQASKHEGDVTLRIKGPSVDIKRDDSKPAITDTESPHTEDGTKGLGSPSKFKLPSFKMPKLSFSRAKAEEEKVSVETECKVDQPEIKDEPKNENSSPKMSLTSFGEILKNVDVEFDVQKSEKEEEIPETSKVIHEAGKPSETKPDATKSPEKTGWFKFPKFGLSSPSEPPKISDKDEPKEQKSPKADIVDEEISPTCSIQSSDAFADISSTVTSEHVGLSSSSPTKVTVKYSDPSDVAELEEMPSDIITSTARTELISVEPNMPEKITILSSGVSSSSEDTLKLESQKIHIITSNIQATPEAQHAKLLTAIQVQPAGGLTLKSEIDKAASWTADDSQSGTKTIFERHLVRKTSSESKETIVVTKQITHTSTFESSEPISGETVSSIQRLRESVHSEKMRFFDGTEE